MSHPSLNNATMLFLITFSASYMVLVLRETIAGRFDLYDFIMLSMLAIVPCGFVVFPNIVNQFADIIGVEFPFIIMFGMLFMIVFLFLHRMTAKIHLLEKQNLKLIQELGILSHLISKKEYD